MNTSEPKHVIDDSYVDDSLFFVTSPGPWLFIERARSMCEIVVALFFSHGLPLNFKVNKSECMIHFRGRDASRAKAAVLLDGNAEFNLDIKGFGIICLRVVQHYKHMGSIIYDTGGSAPEVKNRTALMYAEFQPIRVECFQIRTSPRTPG